MPIVRSIAPGAWISVSLSLAFFAAGGVPEVRAAAVRYAAQGWVEDLPSRTDSTITGATGVEFEGVGGSLDLAASDPFRLGVLTVELDSETSPGRFERTPFSLEIQLPDLERAIPAGDPEGSPDIRTVVDQSLVVEGVLDGWIHSDGSSDLAFEVSEIRPGGLRFVTADHIRRYAFPIPLDSLVVTAPESLGPADGGAVRLALQAQIVPEPTTLALFAPLVLGLALRRRLRASL